MQSLCGKEINIIQSGVTSENAGFIIQSQAQLEIDGRLETGDVIFTQTINSFYAARLHLDSRLNHCILHIASLDTGTNLRVRIQKCKPLPTVIM